MWKTTSRSRSASGSRFADLRETFESHRICHSPGGGLILLLVGGFEHQSYGFGEAAPGCLFFGELLLSLSGEAVELGLAAVVGFAPLGEQPAAFFQTMERGIERALLHLKNVARELPDAQRDAVTVNGAEGDDLEDEHVESSLQ